ncbi:unnamed protein product [Candidula unifasciata]|uniref:G-protein coupled receptors family 1 profile domain-containing protein n=1 Tax=Candidula unifasciata TaxID=100452 RepID=A0A8S3ZES5_9EUPU|nr:unnamed protein product [Candidula unifasciata]
MASNESILSRTTNVLWNFPNETSALRSLITYEQYIMIMELSANFGTVFAGVGVIANLINIKTFIAMGLTDGVIMSFFALALFDLAYLISALCLGIAVIFYIKELKFSIHFPIEPYGIFMFFGTCMIFISVANVLTTTFLAVARCMCVSRPLQFKHMFTRQRAVTIMIIFAIFSVVIYLPILVNMGMVQKFDRKFNLSRPSLWISPQRKFIKEIVWMIIDMIFPILTQVIIFVCVVIMINSLQAASKFRQSSASVSRKLFNKDETCKNDYSKDSGNMAEKLTRKDLMVIQQVVLISVAYIICNTPKIIIGFGTVTVPAFSLEGAYSKLYMSSNGLRKHFEEFNAAINLLIYYKYNTKFRSTMRLTCPFMGPTSVED